MIKNFETYYINDEKYIELLKKDICEGVNEKSNFSYKTNVKAKMTSYWYFINDKPKSLKKLKLLLNNYNITESWGNLYSKGDYTLSHNHNNLDATSDNYDISGVLYLTNSKTGTYFNDLNIEIKAEKGKVILFNPNLLHSVTRIQENERITLSFNGYKKKKPEI